MDGSQPKVSARLSPPPAPSSPKQNNSHHKYLNSTPDNHLIIPSAHVSTLASEDQPEEPRVIQSKDKLGRWLRRLINWLPIIFVLGVIIYSYYVYVIEYNFLTLLHYNPPQVVKAVLFLTFYNFLILMLLVNFIITVWRNPGWPTNYNIQIVSDNVPEGWRVDSTENQIFQQHQDRYCGICNTPKPERCHHCSECQRCVLRMDHHCPWFNNCIGYRNYKFFYLSLFYGFCTCGLVFGTLLQELIWELANGATKGNSIQFLIIVILSAIMGSGAMALLFYHTYLSCRNRTTIEQLDRADNLRAHSVKNYDQGIWENLKQIFGNNIFIWPLPIYHDGSNKGLSFPHHVDSSPLALDQSASSAISWIKDGSDRNNKITEV